MNDTTKTLLRAMTGLLALGTVATSTVAVAGGHSGDEKCAGVIKAGRNDCSTSKNACHTHATVDSDSEAWAWVPKGVCNKIVGSHLTNVKTPDGE